MADRRYLFLKDIDGRHYPYSQVWLILKDRRRTYYGGRHSRIDAPLKKRNVEMGLSSEQAAVVARYLVAGWEAKPHTQKTGETISLRKGNRIATVKPDGSVEEVTV